MHSSKGFWNITNVYVCAEYFALLLQMCQSIFCRVTTFIGWVFVPHGDWPQAVQRHDRMYGAMCSCINMNHLYWHKILWYLLMQGLKAVNFPESEYAHHQISQVAYFGEQSRAEARRTIKARQLSRSTNKRCHLHKCSCMTTQYTCMNNICFCHKVSLPSIGQWYHSQSAVM